MQKFYPELFIPNKGNVFSWLWTAYSNPYVSRSFLKTICQRQNHLRKWSSTHQSPWRLLPASRDLRGLDPAHSWSFPGKRIVLESSLHFTPGLQSSVRILPSVFILRPVCSLEFTLTAIVVNFVSFSDSGSNTSVMLSSVRVLWSRLWLIYSVSFWKCMLKNDKYKFFCWWSLM